MTFLFFFFYMFLFVLFYFFFFQAEDGIRDLVRSRGLGDVYKRQVERGLLERRRDALRTRRAGADVGQAGRLLGGSGADARPVSYTHLTLPTSDLV